MGKKNSLKNDRLLRALQRQPVDCTPLWLMRQAGRYLPEYRAARAKAGDFLTLCKTPKLACEVTLQPIQRYDLDAAIIFSDILTIPDAMGLGLYFTEGEGPRFQQVIRTAADINKLKIPDSNNDLNYVGEAISLVQHELARRIPLIGFAGSPWTIATYMVEGGASKDFKNIKKLLYTEPALLHQLLAKLAMAITDYLNMQITAGVDVVMLFDTWGGVLTARDYELFSLHYMQQIITGLKHLAVPIILFTKGGGQWLEKIAASGCNGVGLDWTTDIKTAKERVGDCVALQGNMDPTVLYSTPERIRSEVQTILAAYGNASGHIFNLGHGILPDVPPEHVQVLVEAVHELSSAQY